MFEIKVPEFGESIKEVQVATWLKKPGDWVDKDEDLVELESEKASQALGSDEAGILEEIKVADGEFAQVGDILCLIKPGEKPSAAAAPTSARCCRWWIIHGGRRSARHRTGRHRTGRRLDHASRRTCLERVSDFRRCDHAHRPGRPTPQRGRAELRQTKRT